MLINLEGFHGATDLSDVIKKMTSLLKDVGQHRPVVLFFGRPSCQIMKEIIIPDIEYFHFRSGEYIECFCLGYVQPEGEYFTPTNDPENNMFSARDFINAVNELEKQTSWKYGGETEIIILNAYRAPNTKQASLDFKTVISFCLEEAERSKAITNTRKFLELLIRFSVIYNGKKFVYNFSDHLGLREAASGIKQFFFSLLPNPLKESMAKSLNFYVKDYSGIEITATALKLIDQSDKSIIQYCGEELGQKITDEKKRILKNNS